MKYLGSSDEFSFDMKWMPQPPDLNPIELLWGYLDRTIRAKSTKSDLWEMLHVSCGSLKLILLKRSTRRNENFLKNRAFRLNCIYFQTFLIKLFSHNKFK